MPHTDFCVQVKIIFSSRHNLVVIKSSIENKVILEECSFTTLLKNITKFPKTFYHYFIRNRVWKWFKLFLWQESDQSS